MAIYIRGDIEPFLLKAIDDAGDLYGYWATDGPTIAANKAQWVKTNRARIVADGAAQEVEQVIATLPRYSDIAQGMEGDGR